MVMLALTLTVLSSVYAQPEWLRLEPESVKVARGGSAQVLVHVGEYAPGFEVWLSISGVPEWFTATLTPDSGVTPFTSTLEIGVSSDAPPGTYAIHIEAWSGELLLESADLTVEVIAFEAPEMEITRLTCPEFVTVGEGFYVEGGLSYEAPQETSGRLRVYLNGALLAYKEFTFAGSGTATFSAFLMAPEEPGDALVKAVLQYFDPVEEAWVTADTKTCVVEVRMPPTSVEVVIYGLPLNLTTNVQVYLPEYKMVFTGEAGVNRSFTAVFEIDTPTVVHVTVDGEVEAGPGVKYVAENAVYMFVIPPGMIFKVSFNYSAWYLLRKEIAPKEEMLKVLEEEKWLKAGETANVSAPSAFQARNEMFTLQRVEVDGVSYEDEELLMDGPHHVVYMYRKLVKVTTEVEPEAPELAAAEGEWWVGEEERLELPFETVEVGKIRYVPVEASSKLGSAIKAEDGVVEVSEPKPGDLITLRFRREALVLIKAIYVPGEPFEVAKRWVEVGGTVEEDVSHLLEPGMEGVRVKVLDVVSELPAELREGVLRVSEVSEPVEVEVRLKRFYRVRNQGVIGWPKAQLECRCEGCEWIAAEGVKETWAPEGVVLACEFPQEWRFERIILALKRGFVGDSEIYVAGKLEKVIHKPVEAGAEVASIRLYELRGRTDRGEFKGAGLYKEGAWASWKVEPCEVPAEGLAGAIGLVWRAVNPSGVELMNSDKEVVVEWELTAKPPLTFFVAAEAAAIGVLALTSSEYFFRWRRGISRGREKQEPYMEGLEEGELDEEF